MYNPPLIRHLMLIGSIVLIFWATEGYARVFNFTESGVAGYVRGTGGNSKIYGESFRKTSGSETAFKLKDDVEYNFSGEFGFVFQLKNNLEMQIGAEGLQSKNNTAKGFQGVSELMEVDSKVTVFSPILRLGFVMHAGSWYRTSFYGGLGYAQVKVTNDYTQTAAGNALYSGALTYKETWESTALNYDVGFNCEVYFFDNTTMSLMAGWRELKVSDFTYASATTGVRGGASTSLGSGADVLDNNGNKVDLDMGGPYVGISFRFYIPPLN